MRRIWENERDVVSYVRTSSGEIRAPRERATSAPRARDSHLILHRDGRIADRARRRRLVTRI